MVRLVVKLSMAAMTVRSNDQLFSGGTLELYTSTGLEPSETRSSNQNTENVACACDVGVVWCLHNRHSRKLFRSVWRHPQKDSPYCKSNATKIVNALSGITFSSTGDHPSKILTATQPVFLCEKTLHSNGSIATRLSIHTVS